ncbi:DUF3320 domain-containing protein [Nocardia sp. NPDC004340]
MRNAQSAVGQGNAERLAEVLERWRGSLIDLTGRNRLLNFRHTAAATLDLEHPPAAQLLAGLVRGMDFAPLPEEEPGLDRSGRMRLASQRPRAVITQKTTGPALRRSLKNLSAKSTQMFNDYGLWTLQIGVGMLNWRDASAGYEAPLVLVPALVELTRTGEYRLRINEEDEPRHNPALAVKLEQFQVDWSKVADLDPMDLPAVLAAARAAVAHQRDWSVSDRVVLAQFASHKEAMYKDLLDNQSRVMASDLVRAVALGPRSGLSASRFDFAPLDLARIDELSPPEQTPLVLDADVSQRQAVAAAVARRSFVLDGPPGTGKSQTIANMIAGLLHAGRTVLFVSEKAAALDVVLDRLRSTGLDSYALALHSHNASRKAVAQELGRCLTEVPSAPELPAEELTALRGTRESLSAYAAAMNEVRGPLGASVHDVIGMVGRLSSIPVAVNLLSAAGRNGSAAVEDFRPERLSAADVRSVVDAAEVIAEVWPVMVDKTFVWRGLRGDVRNARVVVERARAALDQVVEVAEEFRELTGGTPAYDDQSLTRLSKLLELTATRPPVPMAWLTGRDPGEIDRQIRDFQGRLRKLRHSADEARAALGPKWDELPGRVSADVSAAETALARLSPPGLNVTGRQETILRHWSREFDSAADHFEQMFNTAVETAAELGSPPPADEDAVRGLCELIVLTAAEYRPLHSWLTPDGAEDATRAAVRVVADRIDEFLARMAAVQVVRDAAEVVFGLGWQRLPSEQSAELFPSELALAALTPPAVGLAALNREQAGELGVRFALLSRTLESADDAAAAVAGQLGCPLPATVEQAANLLELIDAADSADRAPRGWFEPEGLVRVAELLDEIEVATVGLAAAHDAARQCFQQAALDTPGLQDSIAILLSSPRGLGGVFSRQVRQARKAIAPVTIAGTWRREVYGQLPLAVEWHAAHHRLRTLVVDNAELLGGRVDVERPDVDRLRNALAHARLVHRLAPAAVADPARRRLLAACLADDGAVPGSVRQRAFELADGLSTWRDAVTRAPLADKAVELTKRPLREAAEWLHAHLEPLRQGCALLDHIATARGLDPSSAAGQTLVHAREAIGVAHRAQWVTRRFEAQSAADIRLLGPWYFGLETVAAGIGKGKPPGGARFAGCELVRRAVDSRSADPATESDIAALGHYAKDLDSAALWRALEVAHRVVDIVPDAHADPTRRQRFSQSFAWGQTPSAELPRLAERLRDQLEHCELLAGAPDFAEVWPSLSGMGLGDRASWLRAHLEAVEIAADLLEAVSRASGRVLTVAGARAAVVKVAAARAAQSRFDDSDQNWRELLGELYVGADTDLDAVHAALDWADNVRRRMTGGGHSRPVPESAARVMLTADPGPGMAGLHEHWQQRRSELCECFDIGRVLGIRGPLENSLTSARAFLGELAENEHGPEAWQRYLGASSTFRTFGLSGLPERLAKLGRKPADLAPTVERMVLTAWVDYWLSKDSRLSPARAADRDRLVDDFRRADTLLVRSSHATVIAACNARRPRSISSGAAAILQREAGKKTRHMPVRVLLDQTRDVVQRIKPCFMMSPLTVSQFLPPDFRFDVVIFDEASQVLPQDAANSIYRGDALIVAGDQKQLPPTAFFTAAGSNDGDEWNEDDGIAFESVLDLCKGSGVLPSLPLRWHYRSRHENLIAFSNHEFYGGSMVTFPGVLEAGPDIGVEFIKADGVYDRGRRRDNPREAEVVAQRVMHHAETRPDLTLGVVALSKPQADAIEEAVQRLRQSRPEFEDFFTDDRLNGFFVKNLESVQGDERDVILLSIGYGPDESGKLRSVFGPINSDGGWRRLNVAVTRARRRLELIASFHGADLPESPNPSVQHLKRYLTYAEHGPAMLGSGGTDLEVPTSGPFEEDVIDTLRDWGYEVEPQVGVAAYRVDMAVRHPAAPGVFALGVECDGAMYHASRAARDRDRLREAVLRALGWRLHRVWGADWHRDRVGAKARLRSAVEAACAVEPAEAAIRTGSGTSPGAGVRGTENASATVEFVPVEAAPPGWVRPYHAVTWQQLAEVRHRVSKEARVGEVQLQDRDAGPVITAVVLRVVDEEGPIDESVIIARVRSAWGFQRAGRTVQQAIRTVLDTMVRDRRLTRAETTYTLPGRMVTAVRAPSAGYVRKVGEVPPAERRLALRNVITDASGALPEEAIREVAEIFGWSRLGADIRAQLNNDVEILLRRQEIRRTDSGRLVVVE